MKKSKFFILAATSVVLAPFVIMTLPPAIPDLILLTRPELHWIQTGAR
jgi:hypothetical protein